MRLLSMVYLAMLSACVSANPWTRSDIADPKAKEEQRIIDMGYCNRLAAAYAPAPRPAQPAVSAPSSYHVSGSYFPPGEIPSTFYAHVQPAAGVSLVNSYAEGVAFAQAERSYNRALSAQSSIMAGCMAERGWRR